jgi:acyl carrier protein
MEELLGILEEVKPGVNYKEEKDLIGGHILDSIAIVTLVGEINDAYDIDISPVDIIPENFKNIDTIYALITRLQDE